MKKSKDKHQKALEDEANEREALSESRQREIALKTIFGAWDDALSEGVLPDMLASAAVFAAFSDMVGHYGEEVAAEIATGLVERIRQGDFTIHRTIN